MADEYKNRILFATTENTAAHIKTVDDIKEFVEKYAANVPSKNIVKTTYRHTSFKDNERSYISLEFTKQILAGEHFRFITTLIENDTQNILEIIASSDKRLLNYKNGNLRKVFGNKVDKIFNKILKK